MKKISLILLIIIATGLSAYAVDYPGKEPGTAVLVIDSKNITLQNNVLKQSWKVVNNKLVSEKLSDIPGNTNIDLSTSDLFYVIVDGKLLKSSEFEMQTTPVEYMLIPNKGSARLSQSLSGRAVKAMLTSKDRKLNVQWTAILRDGSNYVQQQFVFSTNQPDLNVSEYYFELQIPGKASAGTVDGSPVTFGNYFFASENPMTKITVLQKGETDRVQFRLPRYGGLMKDEPFTSTITTGVVPKNQMRRGFLYYIERERAHPYVQYLHYNSWFDISYSKLKLNEKNCIDAIRNIGDSLVIKRGVALSGFVFDDGWDDNSSLWQFNSGFPNGFDPLTAEAKKYKSGIGMWISPWGGYDPEKTERLKYGTTQGFETNENGFSLAGPKYYSRFKEVCMNRIKQNGASYFKFDGIGAANGINANKFEKDIDALFRLTGELRSANPELFINMTVGTWPSPFFLWYSNSIWRGSDDVNFLGQGTKRQQWSTYRDAMTYNNIVSKAPLFPLNSLMLHGICIAKNGTPAEMNNTTEDIRNEIHSYFASGTGIQELYISWSLLNADVWDILAESVVWSRANKEVLEDTHWVGGDPGKGEVYGWAAWKNNKGTLTLRNPSDKAANISIDIAKAFELPDNAVTQYLLQSPWKAD
ncbi:MAG TPA: hypothetical protein VF298_08830, partial [Bacteroidales bacterium]